MKNGAAQVIRLWSSGGQKGCPKSLNGAGEEGGVKFPLMKIINQRGEMENSRTSIDHGERGGVENRQKTMKMELWDWPVNTPTSFAMGRKRGVQNNHRRL